MIILIITTKHNLKLIITVERNMVKPILLKKLYIFQCSKLGERFNRLANIK